MRRIGNGIFEMRNDGKMEISVMEGEGNEVLGVRVRKRSRNGAGRVGNETVSGGRGRIWRNKKTSKVGELLGKKWFPSSEGGDGNHFDYVSDVFRGWNGLGVCCRSILHNITKPNT